YDLRNDLYASLQTLPPRFYAKNPTGELMSRASSDVAAVRSLVGFGAVSLVGTVFAFAGALAAMLAADPWLTLWALAPYPALVLLWAGGKAVVDGRLSLGALVAFNGYLAYLTWPTIALGWTLSIVRRGLTSFERIDEIIRGAQVDPVAASPGPARQDGRPLS